MKRRAIPAISLALVVLFSASFLLALPGAVSMPASAVTQAEIDALKESAGELEQQQKEIQAQLNAIAADKDEALEQKSLLEQQINVIQSEINNIDAQIAKYDELISQKEDELAQLEQQEAEQYQLFCERVRYMEEEGEVSYWAILFNAEDFSDMLDRFMMVEEIMAYDNAIMDELLATHMLAENGIREPLYLTAMRYAGIAITPEKRPAHVDTVVLDDADTARLHKWFHALPLPEPAPAPEHLLEVRGLGFGYTKGQSTLHDISFSIGKGEMVSIVGRNGAGKSTLAKLICGFETPEQGQVLLNGRDLAQDNIRRRAQHIGYVMQNPNQMISKTMIYEEVALGLQRSGLTEEQIREKVEATLRVCGLYPFRNWPISALSFGQKKRVTIASVLVLDPELILLDEPTAGQDFRHYTDIMEFLRGLNVRGVTVVMITHDMHLMLEYTPRALVFCDGQLIADRSASAVLCDPELIERAALKETSLYTLANRCGIAPAQEFVERFIEQDREVREGGR